MKLNLHTLNLKILHVCVFTDRVVDDLNPGLNFTRKEVESLLHFVEEEAGQFNLAVREDSEEVLYQACKLYPHLITKVQSHFTILISLLYSVVVNFTKM